MPKKWRPTQAQTVGIVWISVAILLVVGAAIFLGRTPSAEAEKPSGPPTDEQNLTSHEDTAYRNRYHSVDRQDYTTTDRTPDVLQNNRKAQTTSLEHMEQPLARAPYRREALVVELNGADTLTLQLLPGIGPARARAIVRYRERLGGYVDAAQLLEVWGVDSALLVRLAPMLRVDTAGVRRLEVNTAPLKQLLRHPYVGHYQARDLVALRSKGVRFGSADDLRAIPSMTDPAIARLLPYVSFCDTISSSAQ